MRYPPECDQLDQVVAEHLPHLRPAQRRGLVFWVVGTVLARSACQNAVIAALLTFGRWQTVRQTLRDWCADGPEPYHNRIATDVTACFTPLLRWIVDWWQGDHLALALDATSHGDQVVALVVSVLYRGCAIPVAWQLLPANQPGAWLPHELRLLRLLRPAVPSNWTVLVLTDRGLWSPRLWRRIRQLGWHPVMRVRGETTFAPAGGMRHAAKRFVPGPGHAWVGRGVAFKHHAVRRAGTLLVVWDVGQAEPWMILTDLPPEAVGVTWYGLRIWIELGFRALKGVGWHWEHTRRRDPTRIARHWLVFAVAMLWVLAYGTRAEDADALGREPSHLCVPPPDTLTLPHRHLSLFLRGRSLLAWLLPRGRGWKLLWLRPEPWPAVPATLSVTIHAPPYPYSPL
jgi:hypothetical protein